MQSFVNENSMRMGIKMPGNGSEKGAMMALDQKVTLVGFIDLSTLNKRTDYI